MKMGLIFLSILVLTSCFKKTEFVPEITPVGSAALRENPSLKVDARPAEPPQLLSKVQREAIYFSASLEKEALRLMTKGQYADDMSLFSVLSFAVEIAAGVKKNALNRLDCTRFRFVADPRDKNLIEVFKVCQKPEALVAKIKQASEGSHLTVTFLIKEWAAVVGLSVAVTGNDVVCDLQIKNKKLSQLECLNWTKNLVSSATSSEELKLKTFIFNRDQQSQFLVKGGIYKDLVERRKIEMRVPLEGKIKLIEKEIEVIDEFAEKPPEPKFQAIEIGAPPKKSDIQQLGELIEKNSQKNQTGGEENQPQSGQQNQEANQKGDFENQNQGQNQNGGIPPRGR
ncbi:MAG: hypothetical protein H7256_04700 [Bdellovibrio sp.]|nr:hypothetical protein [Bdellovibrio sp.]